MTPNSISCQPTPREENICAVVVSYFPQGDFLSRLRCIQPQVAHLVVVDNGTTGQAANSLLAVESEFGAAVIHNSSNLGIATALNQGARWAEDHGCAWALTLDQDSVVAEDIIETLSDVYKEFPEREKLAVIGSNYSDPVTGRPFLMSEGKDHSSWREVKTTITSGSLISLFAYRAIGPFREELFIDCVDFEYCLRARSLGLRIIMARKPLMEHAIGAVTLHRLPWKMSGTANYSPMRRYYMARNQLVLAREYLWREPRWTASALYRHLKATILMCLFEKDLLPKVTCTAIGAMDGLCSKFNRKLG